MSIDAVITRVERNADGTCTIFLGEQVLAGGLGPVALCGLRPSSRMIVENPPPSFEACVGTQVHATEEYLLVGDTKWAERVGYARLRLLAVRKG